MTTTSHPCATRKSRALSLGVFVKLAALLLAPGLLAAATVGGSVKDPSDAAVPGAAVALQNLATSQVRTAETDPLGHFAFADVAPGKYAITVQHAGFEDSAANVEVGGVDVTLSIALKIATQETAVEVAGKRSSLANSDPNYLALRNTMPGASYVVHNLVLKRDNGAFAFTSGSFSFVPPVLGRVVAGVFSGEGTFHLTAATSLERRYLHLISGEEIVDEPFRSVVLWFTDDTFEEIKRQAEATDQASAAAGAWH